MSNQTITTMQPIILNATYDDPFEDTCLYSEQYVKSALLDNQEWLIELCYISNDN